MIIDFKFKNFKSFKDTQEFTMLANSDKEHLDDLALANSDKLSKTRIIYGANASGKSSFLQAMNFISEYVKRSNYLLESNKIGVIPFKFRENVTSEPSEFSITFIHEGIKYTYEFSCIRDKVLSEKLLVYYSAKSSTIFERTDTSNYDFIKKDLRILNEVKTKNLDNKLFLVTAATWNYEVAKPVVDFLMNKLCVVFDMMKLWKDSMDRIMDENVLEDYKKFCLKILNNADISISDFTVNSKKIKDLGDEVLKFVHSLTDDEKAVDELINKSAYNFKTHHNVSAGNYSLEIGEESVGTQHMFIIAAILYYVFKEGKVLFIDEIDNSLHPLLVEYIIKLFKDKELNPHNAQLIAVTHETNLLDLELLRRDDIWFTERDYKTGATELYQLSDFSPRKNENIEKAYLLGRFGAIPFIKGV